MKPVPEWLQSNQKYHDWFIYLRDFCFYRPAAKRMIGFSVVEFKDNEEIVTISSLATAFETSNKTVFDFLNFLHDQGLIKKEVIGRGRSAKTKITIL